jgi:Ca-activated chloride channel family protein
MSKMSKNCMQSIVTAVLTLLVLAACSVEQPAYLAQPATGTPQQLHGQVDVDAASTGLQEQSLPAREELAASVADEAISSKARLDYFAVSPAAELRHLRPASEPLNRENYAHFTDSPLQRVAETPFSTFSIDVDTGAYSNLRRMLNAGSKPARDAVRTEELINYFSYDYPRPQDRASPFSITTEVGPTPWNAATRLLQIGIQGYEVPESDMPAANLVFLVDVSGSMQAANKLELLKSSLKLLLRRLDEQDRISIVVYAGASGIVLEPTPGDQPAKIIAALDGLTAGGSTNGGAGIRLAYTLAQQAYIDGGINRVLLATDGDFNVGTVDFEMLKQLVAERRSSGIGLTTLGFGGGNYNDHLMEQLADAGNGNYAYIDTLSEARKALVDSVSSTLLTIAQDVKIQVEFNPATVAEYRLIGYENRALAREDFANDNVDAGEIGAGHSVTAIYEIALQGSDGVRLVDSRYQPAAKPAATRGDELALVRVRYKATGGDRSELLERPVLLSALRAGLQQTSERYRFATAVAAFGQLLRDGSYTGAFDYGDVLELARNARGADPFGYRGEFLQLAGLAASL